MTTIKLLKNNTLKLAISLLFTAALVFLLIQFVDFNFFFSSLQSLRYDMLLIASICLLLTHLFRIWRFTIVFNIGSFHILFFISTMHYLLNRLLPVRTGEASLPILLKNHYNISYSKGIGALLLLRVFDLWAVFFLFFISLMLAQNINIDFFLLYAFSLSGIIILSLGWIKSDFFINLVINILKKIRLAFIQKITGKMTQFMEQVKAYRSEKDFSFFIKLFLSSFLSWLSVYVFYFFVLRAFQVDLSFFNTLFASTISNFTFILPISAIGNFGTFEAGWALGYHLIGMDKDISVPIGFFANIFATILIAFMSLLGYILMRLINKKDQLREIRRQPTHSKTQTKS